MAPTVHKIHSLPDDAPWSGGLPPAGSAEHPLIVRGLDRVLAIQRPLVLAHLRSIRLRSPEATPEQLVRILERRYLAAVTTGGAAVGATAVVPGIGTGITLALSGLETVGFVESTTLFAQSLAEVHGIAVDNPERARALVMTLMLGKEGVDLVAQLGRQALGREPVAPGGRRSYWGELVTSSLPRAAVGPLADRLKTMFVRRFAATGSASFLGKALPFGIGAAIGGAGNNILGRRVLVTSRRAFGAAPAELPHELEPVAGTLPIDRRMLRGVRVAGSAIGGAGVTVARRLDRTGRQIVSLTRGRGARAVEPRETPGTHELRDVSGVAGQPQSSSPGGVD